MDWRFGLIIREQFTVSAFSLTVWQTSSHILINVYWNKYGLIQNRRRYKWHCCLLLFGVTNNRVYNDAFRRGGSRISSWGGLHLKFFLRYFVWKITILRQKVIFFSNFRGGARRVRPPPPESAPAPYIYIFNAAKCIVYISTTIWPTKIRIIILILDFKLGTVNNRKDYLQIWTEFFFVIINFFLIKTGIRDFLLDIYSAYKSFVWTAVHKCKFFCYINI